MKIRVTGKLYLAGAAMCIGLLIYWYAEDKSRLFINAVTAEIDAGAKELDLARLMPGEWEFVCVSHPYDGPLYLEKYQREYRPVASAQDGSWGLIFIESNGTYESAVGSCRHGFNFSFGCVERSNAILAVKREGPCITYVRADSL